MMMKVLTNNSILMEHYLWLNDLDLIGNFHDDCTRTWTPACGTNKWDCMRFSRLLKLLDNFTAYV